jgi:hypothetical protein
MGEMGKGVVLGFVLYALLEMVLHSACNMGEKKTCDRVDECLDEIRKSTEQQKEP